jgi:hypothetical protein
MRPLNPPLCSTGYENRELFKAGEDPLPQLIAELRKKTDNLRKNIEKLAESDGKVALREVCLSLEESICHEIFGSRAKENMMHRFKYIEDQQCKKQIDDVLEQLSFERFFFSVLKDAGKRKANVRRLSTMPETELESIVKGIIGLSQADAFMRILRKYGLVNADGAVDVFKSPFQGRCSGSV